MQPCRFTCSCDARRRTILSSRTIRVNRSASGAEEPVASQRQQTRIRSRWPSLIFLILAVLLAGYAIYLFRQDQEEQPAPPPEASAGGNQLIHVQEALEAEELDVAAAPGGVPPRQLQVPGQRLDLGDAQLYVFLYPDTAAAEAEADAVAAAVQAETNVSGTPVATGLPFVVTHSNVSVALVGGDDALADTVERAVQRLP